MIKPQLALHLHKEQDKKKPKYVDHEYMIFEKHDGWYGYLDFPSCIIHSRAMREIPSLVELSNKIRENRPQVRGRLIFEIMIEGLEYDSFPTLNGILNRKNEQVDDAYLRVHDFLHEFRFDMKAHTRYEFANEIVQRLNIPEVKLSPKLGSHSNPDVWKEEAKRLWGLGAEGVILKRVDSVYSPEKRNFDLMKIKEELTLDLLVVGIEEGQGKYEGTTGVLVLRDKFNKEHKVSGMTDKQRDDWWENPKLVVDNIVEVKAMKKLKDGSLREPRFKAMRFDKLKTEID